MCDPSTTRRLAREMDLTLIAHWARELHNSKVQDAQKVKKAQDELRERHKESAAVKQYILKGLKGTAKPDQKTQEITEEWVMVGEDEDWEKVTKDEADDEKERSGVSGGKTKTLHGGLT